MVRVLEQASALPHRLPGQFSLFEFLKVLWKMGNSGQSTLPLPHYVFSHTTPSEPMGAMSFWANLSGCFLLSEIPAICLFHMCEERKLGEEESLQNQFQGACQLLDSVWEGPDHCCMGVAQPALGQGGAM